MSQVGIILSVGGAPQEYGDLNWVVDFSYQLDAGGIGQSRVIVGNNPKVPGTAPYPASSALWTSPSATIIVSPNPPGTTNPVVLACPDLVKAAAFGVSIKGIPTQ